MTPLTSSQEALLRGRDQEVRDILENCRRHRLTVVTGPPGMGVTSLLEAGVGPALRREGFNVAVFRDWQGQSFATHFQKSIEDQNQDGKPLVVLLDQFEDYLRCHSEALDAELAQALTRRDCTFVIGMQAHALFVFERLKQHIPNVLGNRIRLEPISREAAKEAIESEARAMGLEVTPDAMEALASAPIVLRNTDRVNPFFLKVATAQLLEAATRVRAPAVDMSMIGTKGGVDRIVLESLDTAINDLNPTHLELFFHWCNILISPDKKRIAVTEKGLTEYAGKLNRFVVTLLPIVTGTHLMRPVETPEGIRYEIARDCLTPIVCDWWERHQAILQSRRRANFRLRSVSIAVTCVVVMYVAWIILSWKDPA